MAFSFLISLLGIVIGYRMACLFVDRKLISKNEMTKIGTAHFFIVTFLFIIMPHSCFPLWCTIFAPLAVTLFVLIFLVNKRAADFRERFRETLSLIILKMKSGKAFRLSLFEAVNESDPTFRAKLGEITSVVAFSQQKVEFIDDEFIREVVSELVIVDQTPHSSIQRLSVFRDRLDVVSDFRHRSGQALAQIRAQSFVMSGLYIAVFVFAVAHFGWRANARLFLTSLFLFMSGALWIWIGGRKMKWKV